MRRLRFVTRWQALQSVIGASVIAASTAVMLPGLAGDDAGALSTPWTTLPADAEVPLTFVLPKGVGPETGIGWRLASKNDRTLASGEATPVAGQGDVVTIALRTPPLRDGVVLESMLTLTPGGAARRVAPLRHTFWIMPKDPFVLVQERWKERRVRIYDPEGTLLPRLEVLTLPHEVIANPDHITNIHDGILVVGEGMSFRQLPQLWEVLHQVSARGVAVLCLAPADGLVEMPGTAGSQLPSPRRVAWQRDDITTHLDRRLTWPSVLDGTPTSSHFCVRGEGAAVMLDLAGDASDWTWLEFEHAPPRGRLVLCGLSLASSWEASPTPAWLFASILESLARNHAPHPGESP